MKGKEEFMKKYKVRTEDSTIFTDDVIIKGSYAWIEEEKTLYRILKEDEVELQADAIISLGETEMKACRVSIFENAETAFGIMEYNVKAMDKALESLESTLDKESEENVLSHEPLDKPKTYVADYLFNYFGGDKVEDKIITGAEIDVAIRPYKNGKLVQFRSEKETYFSLKTPSRLFGERIEKIYLTSMVSVSFDRKSLYRIDVDESIKKLFCEHFGWDTIKVEAVAFGLDYAESEWMSVSWYCGKEVFDKFITNHLDEFDIKDNVYAQCPSYSWLDE